MKLQVGKLKWGNGNYKGLDLDSFAYLVIFVKKAGARMTNKKVFLILGITLVLIGLLGITLYKMHAEKQAALRQLVLLKQREEARARAALEERRAAQERRRVEVERKRAEIAEKRRLAELRKFKEEEARRRAEKERREAQRREEEARREAARREQEERAKRVRISIRLDANRREVEAAIVHAGDRMTIRLNKVRGAQGKVYAALGPNENIPLVGVPSTPGRATIFLVSEPLKPSEALVIPEKVRQRSILPVFDSGLRSKKGVTVHFL